MAANYSILKIENNHSNSSFSIVPPLQVEEIPHSVENAGVYINHGILIGEILGLNMENTIETMDMLHRVGAQLDEDAPNRVIKGVPVLPEVTEDLIVELESVLQKIRSSVDDDGRPLENNGNALNSSPRLDKDEEGRLFIKSHHIYLFELREMLIRITELLRYGFNNNLLITYE